MNASAADALKKGRMAWPELRVDETAFVERISAIEAQLGSDDAIVFLEDVYLTQSCLDGDPKGQEELDRLLSQQWAGLGHFQLGDSDKTEIHQLALTSLLISKDEQTPPRLTQFTGKGSLPSWLQMVLIRTVLDRLRREKRFVPTDDEWLLGQPADSVDLDLHVLKQRYAGQFSEAFRCAIQKLTRRQRNILRQHHLDGLTLEELGLMYRVHRSTAANWLTEAKNDLLMHTRDEISERTGLPRLAVDSLMRLVQSQLDISTGVFLSAETKAPSDEVSP